MNPGFRAIEAPDHRKRTCRAADEKTANGVHVEIDEDQVDRYKYINLPRIRNCCCLPMAEKKMTLFQKSAVFLPIVSANHPLTLLNVL